MNRAIVTTTINPPTEALKKFVKIAREDGWKLIIVGDKKTPHEAYAKLSHSPEFFDCVKYLNPDEQQSRWPKLSELIGWNCIQRRNFGILMAYQEGAEIIATIDDDNIPHKGWGNNCLVGKTLKVSTFGTEQDCFDPLSITNPAIWHRGFPIQLLTPERFKIKQLGMIERKVLVQADFWNEEPDVDAVCRMGIGLQVQFLPNMAPFAGNKIAPFNSQNTFLSREVIPEYFLFPHIGRMDDIWASFHVQTLFPDSVIYSRASVTQKRNEHDLFKDLQAEMLGYEHNVEIVKNPNKMWKVLPKESIKAYDEWKKCFK